MRAAMFLRISSPTPYKWRRYETRQIWNEFSYGGTGVFNTLVNLPNMTTQINSFQNLIQENAYTKQDLDSSIALVSVAGNDYTNFLVKNRSLEKLPTFTASLVNQLSLNLKRIQSLGVKKIAVTGLEPLGAYHKYLWLLYFKIALTLSKLDLQNSQPDVAASYAKPDP